MLRVHQAPKHFLLARILHAGIAEIAGILLLSRVKNGPVMPEITHRYCTVVKFTYKLLTVTFRNIPSGRVVRALSFRYLHWHEDESSRAEKTC